MRVVNVLIPMKTKLSTGNILRLACAFLFSCPAPLHAQKDVSWSFVSVPDFLNVDVDYPEPKWDDAIDFTLTGIKGENPEFVLVAGDMVMGRWWRSREQIEYMADIYYTAWKSRMDKFGLKYYVAIGDHELGDNPWLPQGKKEKRGLTWDCAPLEFLPYYEEAFVKHFDMPRNGPKGKEGMAYFVQHENALIVTIDVFDKDLIAEHGQADVSADQIAWLDSLLGVHKNVPFRIVQGHTPIIGPVKKKNSSGIMLKDGAGSPLWKTMVKHGVDLYLCGEVHAITCIEQDGIMQISHGALFGYTEYANYLTVEVRSNALDLTLKEIPLQLEGRRLPQSAMNEPREYVRIIPEDKYRGFRVVGKAVLQKAGKNKKFENKSGHFSESAKSAE